MINIKNRERYLKGKPQEKIVTPVSLLSSDDRAANLKRIMRYQQMWDALDSFRRRRKRNKEYFHGNQWGDLVEVEQGKYITEEQNIREQGKVPLKNNMISATVTSILGVFRNSYAKPEVIARSVDNQKLGEMNTCIADYIYQYCRMKEIDAKDMLEYMISGCCLQMADYQFDNTTMRNEMRVVSYNPSRMFINEGIEDPRGSDITTIGVVLDMPLDVVVAKFARTKKDADRIREIYKTINKDYLTNLYRTFTRSTVDNLNFLQPVGYNSCRVIQAWELEAED
jgi:hypothetical protein